MHYFEPVDHESAEYKVEQARVAACDTAMKDQRMQLREERGHSASWARHRSSRKPRKSASDSIVPLRFRSALLESRSCCQANFPSTTREQLRPEDEASRFTADSRMHTFPIPDKAPSGTTQHASWKYAHVGVEFVCTIGSSQSERATRRTILRRSRPTPDRTHTLCLGVRKLSEGSGPPEIGCRGTLGCLTVGQ